MSDLLLTSATVLIRNPDLIATDMDGETVMMSIERGEYFGLSGVGGRVWALMQEPVSVDQIAQTICHEYAVDLAVCQADMQRFAQEMLQNGLASLA